MNNNNTTDFEKLFHDDLYMYLRSTDMVDERLPEAPDLEQLWPQLGQSYVADGIREYNTGYPSVALGWIMFLGMAVAKYWDVEWDTYSKVPDLYLYLRDRIDFDHMDDYILDKVLCLDVETRAKVNDVVAESASRTYSQCLSCLCCRPSSVVSYGYCCGAEGVGLSHDEDVGSRKIEILTLKPNLI